MNRIVLNAALVLGALIDGGVALVALFVPWMMGPLFDFPAKDSAVTLIAGGEFLVVALVYVAILRDQQRLRPLLWLVALDQLLAALLPAIAVWRGDLAGTWKVVAPMPLSLLLAAIFVWAALRTPAGTTRN